MQIELQTLQRELGITFLLVTHDQEEALSMSDIVCVMNAGTCRPDWHRRRTIYDQPDVLVRGGFRRQDQPPIRQPSRPDGTTLRLGRWHGAAREGSRWRQTSAMLALAPGGNPAASARPSASGVCRASVTHRIFLGSIRRIFRRCRRAGRFPRHRRPWRRKRDLPSRANASRLPSIRTPSTSSPPIFRRGSHASTRKGNT